MFGKYKAKSLSTSENGFTLIELMIVISIIGLLASIAIPFYQKYRERSFVTETMSDLINFEKAFISVAVHKGEFPNDSHIILPSGVDGLISSSHWLATTPLGGNYNWEGLDNYPYAGIAILGATAKPELLALLDHKLDDGDLATGRFQLTPNGRHTYMIDI